MTFLKWNIDITTQSQVLSVHALTSLFILDKMRKQESTHQRVATQQKHPKHNKLRLLT